VPHDDDSLVTRAARIAGFAGIAVGVGLAAAGPIGYPIWLAWATRGKAAPEPPDDAHRPRLSVVIPAYREAAIIAVKVEDTLANGYDSPPEVVVVADDPETAAAAARTPAVVVSGPERRGKSAAIEAGVSAATGDVVVLTDANAALDVGSLSALGRWFADETIGAVAGEKSVLGQGQDTYWRFESWLKRREFRLGTTIGLLGEIGAVRRSILRPVPHDVSVDDLWIACDVLSQGYRIAYEPAAAAQEPPSRHWGEEWERRTRVVAGTLDVLIRRRALLSGHGPVSVQLWGHRLVRSSLGPVAHLALLVVGAERVVRGHSGLLAKTFVTGNAVGVTAAFASTRGYRLPLPARIAGQVMLLQAVALGGLLRFARREGLAAWPKADRNDDAAWGGADSPA
jgi:poly-beta-1,6-N-acetyl-D-glucosamine synthase